MRGRLAEIDEAVEAERAQRRHAERHVAGDVTQRVAAAITVCARVRQLADAGAVEDDDDGAGEGGQESFSWRNWSTDAIVVGDSPGPSNQIRLGSLRNHINCRLA